MPEILLRNTCIILLLRCCGSVLKVFSNTITALLKFIHFIFKHYNKYFAIAEFLMNEYQIIEVLVYGLRKAAKY